jgi:hypothetical protein
MQKTLTSQRHTRVDERVLLISETEIFGKEKVGTGDQRLIQAREKTTHGCEDDQHVCKMLGILELQVKESLLVPSLLQLLLHIVNQVL